MRRTVAVLLLMLCCPWQLCASSQVRSLLVFPFENLSPRADLNWIAESFAQVLSSRLPQPDNYVLDRDERNAAYLQLGMPTDAPLTLASEYKVAQTLGVDWAILGNFNVTDHLLVAHAQLLNVKSLKLSTPLEVSGDLTELVDSRRGWSGGCWRRTIPALPWAAKRNSGTIFTIYVSTLSRIIFAA